MTVQDYHSNMTPVKARRPHSQAIVMTSLSSSSQSPGSPSSPRSSSPSSPSSSSYKIGRVPSDISHGSTSPSRIATTVSAGSFYSTTSSSSSSSSYAAVSSGSFYRIQQNYQRRLTYLKLVKVGMVALALVVCVLPFRILQQQQHTQQQYSYPSSMDDGSEMVLLESSSSSRRSLSSTIMMVSEQRLMELQSQLEMEQQLTTRIIQKYTLRGQPKQQQQQQEEDDEENSSVEAVVSDPYHRHLSHHERHRVVRSHHARELNKIDHLVSPRTPSVEYQPLDEWQFSSFPDLTVVGLMKAGTSHLYKLFESHPQTLAGPHKEFCAASRHSTVVTNANKGKTPYIPWQQRLYSWHEYYYRLRNGELNDSDDNDEDDDEGEDDSEDGEADNHSEEEPSTELSSSSSTIQTIDANSINNKKKTLNGCLSNTELLYRARYVDPPPTAKVYYIFRDPADWVYAAFNFFYDETLEDPDYTDGKIGIQNNNGNNNHNDNDNVNYRSPELFHEFVLSDDRLKPSRFILQDLKQSSVTGPRKVMEQMGSNNVVFLKNEDMVPNRIRSSGFLQTLADTSGLSIDGFDPTVISSKTNCNANKGVDKMCEEDDDDRDESTTTTTSQNSSSSSYRPMLESTRRLIYIMWNEECRVWAEEFGIVYPDCINALPDV